MSAFRALWDIDMGVRRIAPGEVLELDRDDPALPGLLAAGVLDPLPEPKKPAQQSQDQQSPAAPGAPATETPGAAAPAPASVEAGAPVQKKPVRGRRRAG